MSEYGRVRAVQSDPGGGAEGPGLEDVGLGHPVSSPSRASAANKRRVFIRPPTLAFALVNRLIPQKSTKEGGVATQKYMLYAPPSPRHGFCLVRGSLLESILGFLSWPFLAELCQFPERQHRTPGSPLWDSARRVSRGCCLQRPAICLQKSEVKGETPTTPRPSQSERHKLIELSYHGPLCYKSPLM